METLTSNAIGILKHCSYFEKNCYGNITNGITTFGHKSDPKIPQRGVFLLLTFLPPVPARSYPSIQPGSLCIPCFLLCIMLDQNDD